MANESVEASFTCVHLEEAMALSLNLHGYASFFSPDYFPGGSAERHGENKEYAIQS